MDPSVITNAAGAIYGTWAHNQRKKDRLGFDIGTSAGVVAMYGLGILGFLLGLLLKALPTILPGAAAVWGIKTLVAGGL